MLLILTVTTLCKIKQTFSRSKNYMPVHERSTPTPAGFEKKRDCSREGLGNLGTIAKIQNSLY